MILEKVKKYKTLALGALMIPIALSLTGCARPNDEDMVEMLSKAYQCKWIKVDDYEKTDSMPGIWTYIAQYDFNLRFVDRQVGAYNFIKGLYNTVPGETDWKKVLQNPNARAYIRDNCGPSAQKVMEQIAVQTYLQLQDKKQATIKLPIAVNMTGWAETSSGREGWTMEMRRDKLQQKFVWSEPVARKDLIAPPKTSAK